MAWQGSDRAKRLPAGWARIRSQVLARDRGLCRLAGERCTHRATEVDHIVRGDDHRLSNLQAVCSDCHASKTAGERSLPPSRSRMAEPHPGLLRPPGPPHNP